MKAIHRRCLNQLAERSFLRPSRYHKEGRQREQAPSNKTDIQQVGDGVGRRLDTSFFFKCSALRQVPTSNDAIRFSAVLFPSVLRIHWSSSLPASSAAAFLSSFSPPSSPPSSPL